MSKGACTTGYRTIKRYDGKVAKISPSRQIKKSAPKQPQKQPLWRQVAKSSNPVPSVDLKRRRSTENTVPNRNLRRPYLLRRSSHYMCKDLNPCCDFSPQYAHFRTMFTWLHSSCVRRSEKPLSCVRRSLSASLLVPSPTLAMNFCQNQAHQGSEFQSRTCKIRSGQ